jgi:hypothetical protein
MIHPDTRLTFIDPMVGLGVVATGFIPCGTLTWVKDPHDLRIPGDAVAGLCDADRQDVLRYTYATQRGERMLCGDIGRYMNHSCQPNCVLLTDEIEIAVSDIAPGAELTNDYVSFFLSSEEEFECRCGTPDCRGKVDSSRLALRKAQLHALAKRALRHTAALRQPLFPQLSTHADTLLRELMRDVFGVRKPITLRRPREQALCL